MTSESISVTQSGEMTWPEQRLNYLQSCVNSWRVGVIAHTSQKLGGIAPSGRLGKSTTDSTGS